MERDRQLELLRIYGDGLLSNTLPFWFPRSIDRESGGYLTCFDRDGTLLQTDKAVWLQGRRAWLLATLYNTVEKRAEWLADRTNELRCWRACRLKWVPCSF